MYCIVKGKNDEDTSIFVGASTIFRENWGSSDFSYSWLFFFWYDSKFYTIAGTNFSMEIFFIFFREYSNKLIQVRTVDISN